MREAEQHDQPEGEFQSDQALEGEKDQHILVPKLAVKIEELADTIRILLESETGTGIEKVDREALQELIDTSLLLPSADTSLECLDRS